MRPLRSLAPRLVPPSAVIALLLGPVGLAACKPSTVTDTSRRIYCQVVADAPERDNDDAPSKIIARVRYACAPPGADTLRLTLRLQRQNAKGRWVDVAKKSYTLRKQQTVGPQDEVYRRREISIRCASGVFRTMVTGTSKARGYTSRYEQIGPRNFDPCRPSLFAT